jgi:membrane protein implicated in regulation of membrane protease activity
VENFYPLFAVLAAVAALFIGAAELILLGIKPVAFLTWLGGWAVSMSLTFSGPLNWVVAGGIATVISVFYVMGARKIWRNAEKKG